MTDPLTPLAIVRDYGELHLAMRARKNSLQISNETLANLSGMHDGHVNKMMADPPSKKMGIVAFGNILQALCLKLLVVEDVEMRARLATRMIKRAEKQVRDKSIRSKGSAADVILQKTRHDMRKMGVNGGHARWNGLSKKARRAIATAAINARWKRRRAARASRARSTA